MSIPLTDPYTDNRLTNRWSAAKGSTAYSYDAAGNLTFVAYPVSHALNLGYDALNRLTSMVDAVGTTAYAYDAASQLVSEGGLWPNDTVSVSYANRLRTGLGLASPSGGAWAQSYGYDSMRRLTSVTSPAGAFGYAYDAVELQRVDTLTLPNGAVITNGYDGNARLTRTELLNSLGADLDSYAYTYNLASQRTQVARTAGDYVNYGYDPMGELLSARATESGGVSQRWQEQFGYAYDAAGNLNVRTNYTLVQTFGVNTLNELTGNTNLGPLTVSGSTTTPATSVTVNTSNAVLYADTGFASTNQPWVSGTNTYTAIAQNITFNRSTNSVTVNLAATSSYAYDLNGNLLTDGTRNFAYDDENELISVWRTNIWRNDFVYDGKLRRRIAREFTWTGSAWAQTNETRFIYDGNLVVQERNTANQPLVEYTRGKDLSGTLKGAGGIGGLLARSQNSLPPTPFYTAHSYYHADGNGNVTALINASQTVVAKYLYDPFGNTLAQSGSLADANAYRFSSKEWNANSGLYYYLYRSFDPNLQRWPNRDPLGDDGSLVYYVTRIGPHLEPWSAVERAMMVQQFDDPLSAFTQVNLNPSLVVANNPIDNVDPRGLDWLDCMANCVQAHDPLNNAGKVCLSALGGTFPKSWWPAGGGVGGGGSPVTTFPSRLGLGGGVGNPARIVGRIFSPIWIGYGLYLAGAEAACAGTCTGDPTTTFPQTGSSNGGAGGSW